MSLEIGGLRVGDRQPLFVIAELGLNHNGSIERALAMVDAAAAAGASAVKLQTFKADELVASHARRRLTCRRRSLREFFRQFELDRAAHHRGGETREAAWSRLYRDAVFHGGSRHARGDRRRRAQDRQRRPHLRRADRVCRRNRAAAHHVDRHVDAGRDRARGVGRSRRRHVSRWRCFTVCRRIRCWKPARTSAPFRRWRASSARPSVCPITPATPLRCRLPSRSARRFTNGTSCCPATTASIGRCRARPTQLAEIVAVARRTQAALGHGRRECLPTEAVNLTASRRALHATRALVAGDVIAAADVVALRPSRGLPPNLKTELVGTTVTRAIEAGAPFLGHDLPVDTEPSWRRLTCSSRRRRGGCRWFGRFRTR